MVCDEKYMKTTFKHIFIILHINTKLETFRYEGYNFSMYASFDLHL